MYLDIKKVLFFTEWEVSDEDVSEDTGINR